MLDPGRYSFEPLAEWRICQLHVVYHSGTAAAAAAANSAKQHSDLRGVLNLFASVNRVTAANINVQVEAKEVTDEMRASQRIRDSCHALQDLYNTTNPGQSTP